MLLLGSSLAAPLDATHQPVKRDSAAGCSLLGLNATNDLGSRNFLLGLDDGTTVNPQGTVVTDPQSGAPFKVLGVCRSRQFDGGRSMLTTDWFLL